MNGYRISFSDTVNCIYELEFLDCDFRPDQADSGLELFRIFRERWKRGASL